MIALRDVGPQTAGLLNWRRLVTEEELKKQWTIMRLLRLARTPSQYERKEMMRSLSVPTEEGGREVTAGMATVYERS